MPKAKPDVIYVHRIEAGSWERENILKPIQEIGDTVKMIRTAAFVVVGGATASAVMVAWTLGKKYLDIAEDFKDVAKGTWITLKEIDPLGLGTIWDTVTG